MTTRPDDSEVRRFLEVGDGDGSGHGSGYGSARGDGYGSGACAGRGRTSCEGSGCGSEDGRGYGYGASYGAGCASGYGAGCGSSVGSGDNEGHGDSGYSRYGEGVLNYCGHPVWMVDNVPTLVYSVHGKYARGAILRGDLTLQPCYVARFGNSFAHGDTLGAARCDATAKDTKRLIVQKRIAEFVAAHLDPDAEYDGRDLYEWHHTLTGSCKTGRDVWCSDHGLDPDRDRMTVREFLRLTADAYGGEIIRAVARCYESWTAHPAMSGGRA